MKNEKHTPGPWKTTKIADYVFIGQLEADSRDGQGICELIGEGRDANARLIAAAPDLLEALKKAQTGLSIATGLIELAFEKNSIFIEEATEAANEAIAKATGETK